MKDLGTIGTTPVLENTLSGYEGPTLHLNSDPKKLSAYALKFSDPSWRKEWYLVSKITLLHEYKQ